MDTTARIGSSIRITGEVTAREPLVVAGQVEGTIEVDGHALTIAEDATVVATVTADTIVVHGHVKGELSAAARIAVQNTATVEGELSAPAISVADGAALHGRVATAQRKALSIAS